MQDICIIILVPSVASVATHQVSLTKVMCGAPWAVCVISDCDHTLAMPHYA